MESKEFEMTAVRSIQLLDFFGQEFGEGEGWKELGRHSFSGPQGWATLDFALEFNTGRSP
jgi:hypothetical protein